MINLIKLNKLSDLITGRVHTRENFYLPMTKPGSKSGNSINNYVNSIICALTHSTTVTPYASL